MSHFTVLAIVPATTVGDGVTLEQAIETMMAPYSESLEWEPYHDYLDAKAIIDMAKYYELDPTNLTALAQKMEAWSGKVGGVDAQGLYGISTWNKDSTWDWYEIGGRWAGSMLGKIDAHSGDLVWGDRFTDNPLATLEQEGNTRVGLDEQDRAYIIRCDGGRKRSLALREMRKRAADQKRDEFAKFNAIVTEHGPMLPSIRDTNFDVLSEEERKAVKDAYWDNPTIKALSDAGLFGFMTLPDEVFGSNNEETEVARAISGAVPGYATVTPQGWLSPGRMGWFGMSAATPDSRLPYYEQVNSLIDAAADDDYLVMLDAHV